MGYFQSDSKVDIKKIISIIFQIWFYNLVINILFKKYDIVQYTNIEFLNAISIFNINSYF